MLVQINLNKQVLSHKILYVLNEWFYQFTFELFKSNVNKNIFRGIIFSFDNFWAHSIGSVKYLSKYWTV